MRLACNRAAGVNRSWPNQRKNIVGSHLYSNGPLQKSDSDQQTETFLCTNESPLQARKGPTTHSYTFTNLRHTPRFRIDTRRDYALNRLHLIIWYLSWGIGYSNNSTNPGGFYYSKAVLRLVSDEQIAGKQRFFFLASPF